jgi:hypothetical protein
MPTSSALVVKRSIKKFQIKQEQREKERHRKRKRKRKRKRRRNKAENGAINDEQWK